MRTPYNSIPPSTLIRDSFPLIGEYGIHLPNPVTPDFSLPDIIHRRVVHQELTVSHRGPRFFLARALHCHRGPPFFPEWSIGPGRGPSLYREWSPRLQSRHPTPRWNRTHPTTHTTLGSRSDPGLGGQ